MKQSGQHSFFKKGNKGIHLVLFCTAWSTPCRQQWEILDNLCKPFEDDMEITKIDLDHTPEAAERWTIQSIPTILLLNGNKEIDRFIGLLSAERLQTVLNDQMQQPVRLGSKSTTIGDNHGKVF